MTPTTDTHEHPPIPVRVAAGVEQFNRYYRVYRGWYEAGRFTPDSPDGTPPGISAITRALLATHVPENARPDDPRQIRVWDGKAYSQSPGLGMVPYLCCEDPAEVQPLLDAEWIRLTVQYRRDAEVAAALVAGLPDMVPALAAGLGLPAPRRGVVVQPLEVTWWPGALCVSCRAGQWTGTTRCHRCKADQPGVAWWVDTRTGVVTSEATRVRVVTYGHPACPECGFDGRNEDGSCFRCTIRANPPCPECGCRAERDDGSCIWCYTIKTPASRAAA